MGFVVGFSDGRLGLWARVLARSFATSRADVVGFAFPLMVVVLDEVEVVVWVVGLFVAFCLAVWTLDARLVTVFGATFSFSEETPVSADGALEDGFSFFACVVSAGAVSWLSLTFRSLATITASSN